MNILYVVGTGSEWNDVELRYSLRSIEKYGKNVERIYIVGHCPDFIDKTKVTHIPCKDPTKIKHKNMLYKVLYACKYSDIGDHFLISSDDHYYLREVDFDNYPLYYRNILNSKSYTKSNSQYFASMRASYALLRSHGLTTYQTNLHRNTHWDVPTYNKYKEIFDQCFDLKNGGEMSLIMGNLLIKEGWQPTACKDRKITSIDDSKMHDECLSTFPNADNEVQNFLQNEFPNKSKYERFDIDNSSDI